ADGNDGECGSSAKAGRDQADRQAAVVLEPFHSDPDACRVDGPGTEAREGTAEIEQGQRVRPRLDDPAYRDQYAASADSDARANVRTKLVCDPTGKRCSPGLQRHEQGEGKLDLGDRPTMCPLQGVDEQGPPILQVGDHEHAHDAESQMAP